MQKSGISVRGFTPDDLSLEWYRARVGRLDHSFKYLNKNDYSGKCPIEIGDDFIQTSSLRLMRGVFMQNPDIAPTMRQIFEMLWACRPEKIEGAKMGKNGE